MNVESSSNSPLMRVVGVLPAERDERHRRHPGSIRGRIDPQVGDDSASLTILGWVLGRASRATHVQLLSGSQVVDETPVNKSRPDVAKAFPHIPDAASSGFRLTVAPERDGENEFLVQVVLESGAKAPIGSVRVNVSRAGLSGAVSPLRRDPHVQTCVIRNSSLALTPELVDRVGLKEGDPVQLTPTGGQVFITPAKGGTPLRGLRLWLHSELMASLGWENGDVVGVQPDDRRLIVARVADPMDPAFTSLGEDGAPLPPHWLIETVTGNPRRDRFLVSGNSIARFFADLVEEYRSADVGCPTVMDFGCGCGRVARVLPEYLDCEMFGCDLTAAAVDWCQQHLPGKYLVSTENPPLPLGDACFDALYAVSVLTHLDEAHQAAWLAEWRRLVRPGGLLLVTYNGEGWLTSRNPENREQIERMWEESSGFAFPEHDRWRGVFPEYYGIAYHTHAYVREHWGQYCEVIEQRPPTQTPLPQDLAVLRRPS